MIHLEYVDRSVSPQTVPVVCMHCDTPTCAEVCPADAIKRAPDGVVQTALKPRCIACNNCVLACPFGVPKMNSEFELMMKCDMCYDRTSVGKQPMCTTVCPSRALHYGTWEEIDALRPRSVPHNRFLFGRQEVRTKVFMMVPRDVRPEYVDVTDALDGAEARRSTTLRVLNDSDRMLANLHDVEGG
jgi:Fe-S-cluster-containing dehydrogenase component